MGDWRDGGSVGVAAADADKAQSARCSRARSIRHVLYPSSVSLGVHFALTAAQLKRIRAARGDDDAVLELLEEIEDAWDAEWLVQSDKAWDAMHRALAGDEDFDYTWSHLRSVRDFFAKAAKSKRSIVFTASS